MQFNDDGAKQAEALRGLAQVVNMAANKLNPSYWVGERCWVGRDLLVKVLAMDASGLTFEVIRDKKPTRKFSPNGIYFSPWPQTNGVIPFLHLHLSDDYDD